MVYRSLLHYTVSTGRKLDITSIPGLIRLGDQESSSDLRSMFSSWTDSRACPWAELQEPQIANERRPEGRYPCIFASWGPIMGAKLGLARLEARIFGRRPHESIEVITFCIENDIILGGLPSHTSHKLQPCDVGVFAPLKMTITHLPVTVRILVLSFAIYGIQPSALKLCIASPNA